MVARDREDGCVVEFVWRIELLVVFVDFAVVVDAVSGQVEERRPGCRRGADSEVGFHPGGDELLGGGVPDSAHVAVHVEGESLLGDDGVVDLRGDDVFDVDVERCWAGGFRQVPEVGVADLLPVQGEVAAGRRAVLAEDVLPLSTHCAQHRSSTVWLLRLHETASLRGRSGRRQMHPRQEFTHVT